MNKKWSKIILFLCIASFIFPIIAAIFLMIVSQILGCDLAGEESSQCLALGVNIGGLIQQFIKITWQFPLMMSPQGIFPTFVAIGIIITLIHLMFRGTKQLILSLFCIWYIPISPSVLGIILVSFLARQGNCLLNEGNANPCYILGVNMGDAFYGASVVPWLILLLVPICLFISILYAIIYALISSMLQN